MHNKHWLILSSEEQDGRNESRTNVITFMQELWEESIQGTIDPGAGSLSTWQEEMTNSA